MFLNPFSLNGRIRRSEYWTTNFIYFILYFTYITMIDKVNDGYILIFGILFLPLIWVMFAQSVKRSHDIGNSGWFNLIPFYGLLLLFVNSERGRNKWGESPKE
ncbi:DUF805 domain-containing protein [Empedobacter falsenii]